jgi:hypothetical protein
MQAIGSKCRAPLQEKKLKALALALWWAIVIGPQLSLLTEASKARPAKLASRQAADGKAGQLTRFEGAVSVSLQ